MSTIFMRSALVYHGHDPAPNVHSIVVDHKGRHVVTWDDVMRERRERQALILARKREVRPWRAHRLWVAYFDQDLMGGWHAFLDDFRGHRFGTWLNRGRSHGPLSLKLVRLFPAGLIFGRNDYERFDDWMPAFAETYRRGTQCRRPRGCAFLWWNGRDEPRPITETHPHA